jgi:PAS domain S-box-containing protein
METEIAAQILVVDDDGIRRRATVRLLRSAGYQVVEAATGNDGLRLARESRPDLVLLDRVLPDADGADICQRIKSEWAPVHVFIVLMSAIKISGDDQADGLGQGVAGGADGYIALPIGNRELLARVEALLRIQRAEEALRVSEARFRTIFEKSTVGYSLTAPDGQIKQANAAFAGMLGYSLRELEQLDFVAITHPDDLDESEACVRCLISGEQDTYRMEKQYLHKDGRIVWAIVSTTLLRDAQSDPLHFITNIQDITARKQAEDALRMSEERFRIAFHTSPDAVNINRLSDGVYVDINEGFTTLTGFTREDVLGKTSADIQVWCDLTDREKLVRGLQENGYYRNLEARFRRKNGDIAVGLMSAAVILLQGVPHILSITRDITERKQAEQALRESELRFRQVYEYTQVGIAQVSLEFIIKHANQAYCQMLGYSEEELRGKHLREITHPEIVEENLRKQAQLARGELDHYQMEKQFIHKQGQTIHGILDANLIRDASGNPAYFLGSVVDITERKQAETQRNEQLTELRRWREATLGREMRILDLKHEVNELLRRLGEPIRYSSTETEDIHPPDKLSVGDGTV